MRTNPKIISSSSINGAAPIKLQITNRCYKLILKFLSHFIMKQFINPIHKMKKSLEGVGLH